MEQLNQKMALYKLDVAENFLWDTRIELVNEPELSDKVKAIIDELYALRVVIRGNLGRNIEDFDEEPYEKSEKDCMWERE